MKMLRAGGVVLGLFLGVIGSAKASTLDYAITFSGTGFSGSGDIAVNSTTDVVQSLSGTVNGSNLKLIAPNFFNLYTQPGTGLQWTYDDRFFKSGTPFDNEGLLFSFGNHIIGDIYSIGSQLYLSVSSPLGDYRGEQISLAVSQTPLPAALPMFLTALGGLWFVLRRRNKNAAETGLELEHFAAT
jgi:hypothetical protein